MTCRSVASEEYATLLVLQEGVRVGGSLSRVIASGAWVVQREVVSHWVLSRFCKGAASTADNAAKQAVGKTLAE